MTRDLMRARVSRRRGGVCRRGCGSVKPVRVRWRVMPGLGVVDVAKAGGAGGVDWVGERCGRGGGRLARRFGRGGAHARLDAGRRRKRRFEGREFEGMKVEQDLVWARTTL